jgi:hypothetical protein
MNPLTLLIPQTPLSAFLAPLLIILAALCLASAILLASAASASSAAADSAELDALMAIYELDQQPTMPLQRAERPVAPSESV